MLLQKTARLIPRSVSLIRRASSSATETVIASEHGDKGIITINRPKALNAINLDMVRKIHSHLKEWETTKSLVIIKGEGEKSFCAGGDVRAVVEAGPTEESKAFFREEYRLNALIGYYQIPYVAFIDGITMGGGVGLSVHGKYRVATERTLFAMPETAIGLFPDVGGSFFLPRLEGKLGLYLGLTGHRLKGYDILKSGIATHFCESSKLNDLEQDLLKCKDKNDVEKILSKYSSSSSKEFVLEKHLPEINRIFNSTTVEEIFQKLEAENSDWAQNTLKSLKKMSPTSLKVTHQSVSYGSTQSLTDCLKMEYRLVIRHLEDSDFKEGVRALLIDKDQKPNWKPPTIEGVTDKRVDFYFAKLPANEELQFDNIGAITKSKL